ncbi:hypothetical protein L1276_002591 [Flavobacterium sp. HSC-32F16]|uniref:T9SS sorting signal type C domain-containing protein n=1 Tax=Flavobacterium sp. HSC-32F16 TaxID=2910964 RepID=UPI0020A48A28|nr:T9SS sorting signal type C domain-containing protein [Flavobacterium sp. HSC-32F16]MCP2027434.1 hypothetical protein [Flavobacterium sp. HSC-32F16]
MKKLFLSSVLLFPIHSILFSTPVSVRCFANLEALSIQNFGADFPAKSVSVFETERHRVWINLTNTQGLFKQILIAYATGATNGWDQNYDAPTMDVNPFADFYSINEDKKLVIQGRAVPFDPSDIVPLGYKSNITGEMNISIDHVDGELANRNIYLYDKKKGIVHNLKSAGYTFSTLTGVFTDRFVISYSADQNLRVDDFENSPQDFIITSKNKTIKLKSNQTALKQVSVFDITGKLLYLVQKIGKTELEISGIESGSQVLLVKTILNDGSTINKKVVF